MTDHKALALEEARKYHRQSGADQGFVPGETEIWPSGAVLDEDDRAALVEAALDMRIATARSAQKFESAFARAMRRRKALLCNSGSSANLL
ncbi:lipopolysaccharide biosynthesis protein RfbH, partial [Micromonospora aurantiaca]|nr:lipopolysaccharide biosynthesis protein RfbH [Micromonospora aurantiaca]